MTKISIVWLALICSPETRPVIKMNLPGVYTGKSVPSKRNHDREAQYRDFYMILSYDKYR